MSSMNVLVLGATQGTGKYLVEMLLKQNYQVTVFARNRSKAEAVFSGKKLNIAEGDITVPESLPKNLDSYDAILLLIGVPGVPVSEKVIKATEYDGTLTLLAALEDAKFDGRLLYMTSVGTKRKSLLSWMLNLLKGNTLIWRGRAEDAIVESGLRYTVIRAGTLNDKPGGEHQIDVSTGHIPAKFAAQISRNDVARVLISSLLHPETTIHKVFNVVWGNKGKPQDGATLFGQS